MYQIQPTSRRASESASAISTASSRASALRAIKTVGRTSFARPLTLLSLMTPATQRHRSVGRLASGSGPSLAMIESRSPASFSRRVLRTLSTHSTKVASRASERASSLELTGGLESRNLLFAASAVLLVIVVISYALDLRRKRADEVETERQAQADALDFDPFAGGFPVPPMPGQIAQPSRRSNLTVTATEDK